MCDHKVPSIPRSRGTVTMLYFLLRAVESRLRSSSELRGITVFVISRALTDRSTVMVLACLLHGRL